MNPLSRLSNHELENSLKDLVQKERKLLHVILEHIREIDARKLYLEKAYSSIYEYLTKELGYSGSAAMRRLEAARLIRELPGVATKIQEGSLNLSQIGELSRAIKEKEKLSGDKVSSLQKQELVAVVIGKTTQETQHELSRALDLPMKEYDVQKIQKDESVRLELTLSKDQYQKLLSCKDLAAHLLLEKNQSISIPDVIEFLANQYLDERFKNPKSKKIPSVNKRTEQSLNNEHVLFESKVSNHSNSPNASNDHEGFQSAIITTDAVVAKNKSVTPKTRRLIIERDKCCQYVDKKTGKACKSTFALQVDHKIPRWANGDNSFKNLQVLCGNHNRYKYKKEARLQ
ncbi:HNH endonuclease [Bdellovibrio reynosensis]|uniref:HNH endonuclease n=1 Tax=Bdellovibrio reynosensis TaxID=2835041 RepID=A0ABY4C6M9_9BACT|nr:HNH endonuclease signature motif containing protein [Bdellovibrio reynosensis]UOF00149.1 HNH endonuclease [Bdellovibrio reynosensis]